MEVRERGDSPQLSGRDSLTSLLTTIPHKLTGSRCCVARALTLAVIAPACLGFSTVARAAGDTARAWGNNTDAQLGDGNNTGPDTCGGPPCSTSPIPVSGLSGAAAIAASNHNLALLSTGTVRAWGNNSHGQLGNRNNTGPDSCSFGACSMTPIPVGGLSGVVAISVGDAHSLALLSNGTLMAWGMNSSGELGIGNTTGPDMCGGQACSTKPIPVPGLSNVVAVSAGSGYTFARLANGAAKSWGANYSGQLGNGTDSADPSPTPISSLSAVSAVAAGDTQSLALLSNGSARSWGYNGAGTLGNGNNAGPETCNSSVACSKTPIPVSGLKNGTAVATGLQHDLALVGPSQVLRIALPGRGAGSVGGAGVLCPLTCTQRYPQGAIVNLIANAAPGTGFAGFSGACRGRATCRVALGKDQHVTATFGRPAGTKITKAKIKRR